MNPKEDIYLSSPNSFGLKALETLTASKNWDSDQFARIMATLGIIGHGQAIPAPNRPETIHLQRYRKAFEELLRRTQETGREHARTFFADTESTDLVMSNKISVGTDRKVRLYMAPEKGKEHVQTFIGSVHTHPVAEGRLSHGLSEEDYLSFLPDKREQFMIVVFGASVRMLILKTLVTPNNILPERIKRRIIEISREFFKPDKDWGEQLVTFNKVVCTEFGLTFYLADQKTNDLFSRMNVVD